jgi:hypothetical protein
MVARSTYTELRTARHDPIVWLVCGSCVSNTAEEVSGVWHGSITDSALRDSTTTTTVCQQPHTVTSSAAPTQRWCIYLLSAQQCWHFTQPRPAGHSSAQLTHTHTHTQRRRREGTVCVCVVWCGAKGCVNQTNRCAAVGGRGCSARCVMERARETLV